MCEKLKFISNNKCNALFKKSIALSKLLFIERHNQLAVDLLNFTLLKIHTIFPLSIVALDTHNHPVKRISLITGY